MNPLTVLVCHIGYRSPPKRLQNNETKFLVQHAPFCFSSHLVNTLKYMCIYWKTQVCLHLDNCPTLFRGCLTGHGGSGVHNGGSLVGMQDTNNIARSAWKKLVASGLRGPGGRCPAGGLAAWPAGRAKRGENFRVASRQARGRPAAWPARWLAARSAKIFF